MRRLKVRHERLPEVGELFEILSESGVVVTVVNQRSGRRSLSIGAVDAEQRDAGSGQRGRSELTAPAR